MGSEREITVKLPEMPQAEMEVLARELSPLLEDIVARLSDGRARPPAVVVVADERYPMLPALDELGEYAAVFFYDRGDPRGLVVHVR